MPTEMRLRRHAIEIVTQLPDSPAEALRVLDLAREVVSGFLMVQDASGGKTPNLRAISSESPAGSLSRIQPIVRPGI